MSIRHAESETRHVGLQNNVGTHRLFDAGRVYINNILITPLFPRAVLYYPCNYAHSAKPCT